MPFPIRPFNSGLAGRMFGLFVLATVIPVAVFGLLASQQVNEALTQRSYAALGDATRTYGQTLYQRLTAGAQYLAVRGTQTPLETDGLLKAGFSDAWGFDDGQLTRATGPIPKVLLAELPSGALQRPKLFILDQRVVVIVANPDSSMTFAGVFDPDYLWGDGTQFSYATDYCVWQSEVPLFCSRTLSETAATEVVSQGIGNDLSWKEGDDAWRGASWDLFVGSGFEADSWRILAMQPASVALASLDSFKSTFPYVLLLSLIGAMILASSQIRRTMRPLQALMAGVERFSQRQFDHRIELASQGEFSALASAMNGMAGRLDSQFDAMALLADVDQRILSADGIEWVVEETLQRFRSMAQADFAGVLLLDKDAEFSAQLYRATGAANAATTMTRVELSLQDYRWFDEHPDDSAVVLAEQTPPVVKALWSNAYGQGQVYPLRLDGRLAGSLILGWQESPSEDAPMSEVGRDFADRLTVALAAGQREAELYRRAHFDPLTGLPNRELLHDRLGQALVQARDWHSEGVDGGVGLMFIDLDRFKDVNDSMGHSAGDVLLCEAGRRLEAIVSESATVSRLGGDEFVIVLPRYRDARALHEISQTVLEVLAQPFEVEGKLTYISASLGVARFPEDGDTVGELMRKADTAMYEAKTAGRGEGKLFSAQMDVEVQLRANLQQELHRALENDEFQVVYQPQIRLQDGSVTGAEALVRWIHPVRGMISPTEFVGGAEDAGLIGQLDELVMGRAFGQIKRWLEAGLPIDYVAVNVSARHFSGDFASRVSQRLKHFGLPPDVIEIELTESVFAQDLHEVASTMAELRDMGVRVAIDDFGTGYSSMSYIQDLVFDALKIDQSFVRNLPNDRQSAAIAHAIVAMGRTLGKTVIAEGIETRAQLDCLTGMGCMVGQGYFFSKPLLPDAFVQWIGQNPTRLAS